MNYWKTRALENNAKAQRIATVYSKKEKKLFNDAYKSITSELNAMSQYDVTRTDVWRAKSLLEMREIIARNCDNIAECQLNFVDGALEQIFRDVIGKDMKDFKIKNIEAVTEKLRNQILTSNWSGKNYSARVWTNRNALAYKLNAAITEHIMTGTPLAKVKKQLMYEMGVGYHQADRLIRTESAYVYSAASIETYKECGVRQVRYINSGSGSQGCALCAEDDNKIFDIGSEPLIPRHPNCTCCYAPVIDI